MTFRLYNGNSWIFCREILHTTAFPRENRRFCATGTALALLTHAASQRDGWYGLSRPTKALREEDEQDHETHCGRPSLRKRLGTCHGRDLPVRTGKHQGRNPKRTVLPWTLSSPIHDGLNSGPF